MINVWLEDNEKTDSFGFIVVPLSDSAVLFTACSYILVFDKMTRGQSNIVVDTKPLESCALFMRQYNHKQTSTVMDVLLHVLILTFKLT